LLAQIETENNRLISGSGDIKHGRKLLIPEGKLTGLVIRDTTLVDFFIKFYIRFKAEYYLFGAERRTGKLLV